LYKKLASKVCCKFLVREHQIERVLFDVLEKNLAASRYDRQVSFFVLVNLYKFLVQVSCTCVTGFRKLASLFNTDAPIWREIVRLIQ